jgi:hypothetical protein
LRLRTRYKVTRYNADQNRLLGRGCFTLVIMAEEKEDGRSNDVARQDDMIWHLDVPDTHAPIFGKPKCIAGE